LKKERRLTKEFRMIGMTQKAVAEKIGTTKEVVSNWARGAANISPLFVMKLKEIGIPEKAIRNPSELV